MSQQLRENNDSSYFGAESFGKKKKAKMKYDDLSKRPLSLVRLVIRVG